MTDLVDQMFPPIHRKWTPEYTDFNYWKTPVQDYPLPDLSPPSPALSARSDTSNQGTLARLRNFSLVGSRQTNVAKKIASSVTSSPKSMSPERTLQQMTSFERLSSTLGFAGSSSSSTVNGVQRSASPDSLSSSSLTYAESDDEEDDEAELDVDAFGKRRRRERRRSMTSMPGSLDDEDMHLDEEEQEDGSEDDITEDEEEAAEEAFDEDLLAAGEMKNVPFL